ncbi:MAG: ABC transporter substrate-binding protein [Candidatus Nanopelagicales bacterium]|nr:ABC transporter substrate-binding protein [Candidatus Nanopelagicales bacterium]MCF8538862.1 ABC transporter substrate-binding protein [Candidatus Nanopelagicales bacterium]
MRKKSMRGLGLVAVAASGALVLAGCGGGDENSAAESDGGTTGGTIYVLEQSEQILHLDPQRNYTGVDLAFMSGYLQRTLTAYKYAEGPEGVTIVPDMATDLGTPNADATSWAFTIRDGVTFEDGSEVGCSDVKYGVSRTFAQDVITDGPTYAISLLDIPTGEDGSSVYKGPYVTDGNDIAAFDAAVQCSDDNKTITFNLSRPAGDFNYTVTLLAFSPVPQAADTGEGYDNAPVSSGPYKISEYTKGQKMVLVRNENWNPDSDDYRPAYPDQIVAQFALDPSAIDQRLIADAGDDQTAVTVAGLTPESLATVFAGDDPRFAERSVDGFDPYVRYLTINTTKVPNQKHRQAIAVALNRGELLTIAGGDFAGTIGDGVIKPNLATDYAESGMWVDLFGEEVPDAGNPELAKKLIAESGEAMPVITYDYPQTPTNDKAAASIQQSLAAAGIEVKLNAIEPGQYYGVVLDPEQQNELNSAGWGPDWQNASTVIPELFGATGGFNLSRVEDPAFEAQVQEALANTDREAQATQWKELNKYAMEQGWAVPTRFGKIQYLWGSKVGNAYLWDAYGSLPFGALYVKQ